MQRTMTMGQMHRTTNANTIGKNWGEKHPRLFYGFMLVGVPAAMLTAVSASAGIVMCSVAVVMGWM